MNCGFQYFWVTSRLYRVSKITLPEFIMVPRSPQPHACADPVLCSVTRRGPYEMLRRPHVYPSLPRTSSITHRRRLRWCPPCTAAPAWRPLKTTPQSRAPCRSIGCKAFHQSLGSHPKPRHGQLLAASGEFCWRPSSPTTSLLPWPSRAPTSTAQGMDEVAMTLTSGASTSALASRRASQPQFVKWI